MATLIDRVNEKIADFQEAQGVDVTYLTEDEVVQFAVAGFKAAGYRKDYNKKNYEAFKAWKKMVKADQAE